MEYEEFAARALRRWRGENEDGPYADPDVPEEWTDGRIIGGGPGTEGQEEDQEGGIRLRRRRA